MSMWRETICYAHILWTEIWRILLLRYRHIIIMRTLCRCIMLRLMPCIVTDSRHLTLSPHRLWRLITQTFLPFGSFCSWKRRKKIKKNIKWIKKWIKISGKNQKREWKVNKMITFLIQIKNNLKRKMQKKRIQLFQNQNSFLLKSALIIPKKVIPVNYRGFKWI